jgi:outer membrane protein OmpA-like peptidoglycan-associated protein
MLLYEFEDDDALRVKLAGIVSQLRSRALDTGAKEPYSLTALRNKLQNAQINLDNEELRDMLDSPPLSNLISNIKGDQVIFKGVGPDKEELDTDQSEKTLDTMAKRAAKKPEL